MVKVTSAAQQGGPSQAGKAARLLKRRHSGSGSPIERSAPCECSYPGMAIMAKVVDIEAKICFLQESGPPSEAAIVVLTAIQGKAAVPVTVAIHYVLDAEIGNDIVKVKMWTIY